MSVRTFHNFEVGVLLSSTQSAAYNGPLMGASATEFADSAAQERLSESPLEGPRCMKGLITGLGLEVAMALTIYGIWHLCHSLHLFR